MLKLKQKIKITFVLILSIFLVSEKIEQRKLLKKQVLVMDCLQNLVPPWNEIRVNQLTPNPFDFSGNKSQSIHPNSSHNRTEFCRQSLGDWLVLLLFYLFLYK